MNIETLSEIRSKLAQIAALTAEGLPLADACRKFDITVRSYRRWTEIVEFTRTENAPDVRQESLSAILPEVDAELGRMKVGAGEVLFRLGELANDMYVVVSGSIAVVELDATVGAGEIVGEIGVFSDMQCRTATAVTAEDCVLVRIPRTKALEIAARRPGIGLSIAQMIADRLARNASQTRAALAEVSFAR